MKPDEPAIPRDPPHDPLIDPATFGVWPGWRFVGPMLALFVVAMMLDERIKQWLWDGHLYAKHESTFWMIVKQPGEYWLAASVAGLVWLLHRWRWRGALVLAMAVLLSAWITATLKWVAGRTRPIVPGSNPYTFDPFRGGLVGYFEQGNLSFPSGHATMSFAIAATLAFLWPRWRVIFYAIATLTAAERVVEMAHHASEVVGGAIVGVVGFRLAMWLALVISKQKPLDAALTPPTTVVRFCAQCMGWPDSRR